MAGTGRWLAPDPRNGLFRTTLVILVGVVGCLVLAAILIDVAGVAGSGPRIGALVLVGALASIVGSLALARQLRRPIGALEASCAALEQSVADRTHELDATAKILRVISSSPSDVQPVLDAVAESAARLCDASDALIMGVDGDTMHRIAHVGVITSASDRRPVTSDTPTGRAIVEARTIHVEDILQAFARGEYLETRGLQQATGFRTVLVVPLTRDGRVIGALTIRRLDVHGFTPEQIALVETFADQAVIAIENVRLFKELQARNAALANALDQQTATSEILRAISRSQIEIQPVFDAIADSALRLFNAWSVGVYRFDGDAVDVASVRGGRHDTAEYIRQRYPMRLTATTSSVAALAIVERRVQHVPDLENHLSAATREVGRIRGYRAALAVPMLRNGQPIGSIAVTKVQPGAFPASHIELLQTFADQAVIAIENVRLFKELQARNTALAESLEQQTATAEILRVISRSPTDVQPVLDAVAENAKRICGATDALIMRAEGDVMRRVAHVGAVPASLESVRPLTRDSVAGRAILERRAVQVEDIGDAATAREYPESGPLNASLRLRTITAVPLVRDDAAIGAILIRRTEVQPSTDKQIALLQTFADQAVIAIENVRLFKELETKNRTISEALDQQTATAEILRAISGSPTDVQPVFDTIVHSAARLLDAHSANVLRVVGDELHLAALTSTSDAADAATRATFPRPLSTAGIAGHVIDTRRPYIVADVETDPFSTDRLRITAPLRGFRSMLAVPMIHHERPIGLITVTRRLPGAFSEDEISLLQTFADQAVIAIENVRLFKELEARNAALSESLEQQTATSEILRVISSSPTDIRPVFETIVQSAVRLCGGFFAIAFRFDGHELTPVAHHGFSAQALELIGRVYPSPPQMTTMAGRAVLERRMIHGPDVSSQPISDRSRELALAIGYRAFLAVPMMRDGTAIGVINITRREPEPFSERQIEVMKIFADQAVIAIENVRLFTELEARNAALTEALEQQTATSEILRVISSSQTDVQPVFDAIAVNASRLCGGARAVVLRYDGRLVHRVAGTGTSPALREEMARLYPRPADEASLVGRAILRRAVVHSPDVQRETGLQTSSLAPLGIGAQLSVPMLHDGKPIGVIAVSRAEPGPFTDTQIELVKTFADQGVIAIENVRLLTELEARNGALSESLDQQTATAEILRVISSSPTNVQPVLEVVAQSAARICAARDAVIFQVENGLIYRLAHFGAVPYTLPGARPLDHGSVSARAIVERRIVHVPDILDPEARRRFPESAATTPDTGVRSMLSVPLMRDDVAVGAITIRRTEMRPFTDKQIELLKTFADQAVIAIENVRLFNEIQQKTRELEAANRHKDEFLASMSHELRTPLNAVIGFSEVLLERMFGDVNAKQEEYLHDILVSGRHLLSLINDILDLAKIEAGRMELELEDFDLGQAIDNAVVLVRERATRKGLSLDTRLDRDLGSLRGDQRKIKQILLNLLSNAVKFTPEGGRIEVRGARLDGLVEISVTDTGIGIAAEDLEAVFEEFRQVGTDYAKKHEGTGLGLTLSRKFVELHGGRIWVKSQLGKGSTFVFTLPEKA